MENKDHGAVSPKNQETLDKSGDPKSAEEAQAEELRTLSTQVTTDITAPITAQVKRSMDELHKAT